MTTLDIKGDAAKAFAIMKSGGIAIAPNDTGYGLLASSLPALKGSTRPRVVADTSAMRCSVT